VSPRSEKGQFRNRMGSGASNEFVDRTALELKHGKLRTEQTVRHFLLERDTRVEGEGINGDEGTESSSNVFAGKSRTPSAFSDTVFTMGLRKTTPDPQTNETRHRRDLPLVVNKDRKMRFHMVENPTEMQSLGTNGDEKKSLKRSWPPIPRRAYPFTDVNFEDVSKCLGKFKNFGKIHFERDHPLSSNQELALEVEIPVHESLKEKPREERPTPDWRTVRAKQNEMMLQVIASEWPSCSIEAAIKPLFRDLIVTAKLFPVFNAEELIRKTNIPELEEIFHQIMMEPERSFAPFILEDFLQQKSWKSANKSIENLSKDMDYVGLRFALLQGSETQAFHTAKKMLNGTNFDKVAFEILFTFMHPEKQRKVFLLSVSKNHLQAFAIMQISRYSQEVKEAFVLACLHGRMAIVRRLLPSVDEHTLRKAISAASIMDKEAIFRLLLLWIHRYEVKLLPWDFTAGPKCKIVLDVFQNRALVAPRLCSSETAEFFQASLLFAFLSSLDAWIGNNKSILDLDVRDSTLLISALLHRELFQIATGLCDEQTQRGIIRRRFVENQGILFETDQNLSLYPSSDRDRRRKLVSISHVVIARCREGSLCFPDELKRAPLFVVIYRPVQGNSYFFPNKRKLFHTILAVPGFWEVLQRK